MTGPVESVVRRYFRALDGQDTAAAVSCFAEDATYVRTPAPAPDGHATELEVLTGRAAIEEFMARRGLIDTTHVIDDVVETAGRGFASGRGRVRFDDGSAAHVMFMLRALVDAAGLITGYSVVSTPVDQASFDRPALE